MERCVDELLASAAAAAAVRREGRGDKRRETVLWLRSVAEYVPVLQFRRLLPLISAAR